MLDWALMPLRRYAEFSGRSRRKEYWSFFLLTIAAMLLALGIEKTLGLDETIGDYGPLSLLLILGVLVPGIAVQIRRFHDQDRSGWFVLLNFVPFVGGLIVLVFMALVGTPGDNQYGPDPKASGAAAGY